jgi:uncharacterized protein DUF3551
MRVAIGLAGVILVVLASLASSTVAAHAQKWCGFRKSSSSHVQCGFSSPEVCKQVLGDQTAFCFPDPFFANRSTKAWLS